MKSALLTFAILACLLATSPVFANVPGGGSNGANVTVTDNGSTVTLANGIVSIVCTKSGATIDQLNYTYNNGGGSTTYDMFVGGKSGGQLYWTLGGFSSGSFNYTLVSNPANNGGNYAEISLLSTSSSNGFVEVHFSLPRGATGFYTTVVWGHRNGDMAMGTGELRENMYLSPAFNWSSTDASRNLQRNSGSSAPVAGGPQEVSVWTSGLLSGRYEDKYKYSAPYGSTKVWGWSSVNNAAAGYVGRNIGIWQIFASNEYFNGGPLKTENTVAPMIVSVHGGHYQTGEDSNFAANEVWTHVSGPYFIYCNAVTNTLTGASQTANALFDDATAQAAAEATAWPYSWFVNTNYASASQRGTVNGQIVINDNGNPNASESNLWVGVVQQPSTTTGTYDFQQWSKPYQFWVQSDANGNFSIPDVIAGNNYTLYAFGPGAVGTFMSQNQTGGNPPLLYNLASPQFSVTVTGGATNNLGTINWTPTRVGATVFELGYPDRTGRKFRHGDDWWVGDIGPGPTNPMPVWSKYLEYPFDFPGGANYTVGQNRWNTDWNFALPVVITTSGSYGGGTATINFNLATAPTNGATASLFIGTSADFRGALIVSVNGNNLGSASGVSATPVSIASTGYIPVYNDSDASIREQTYAAHSDERITFPASLLHAGQNTITFSLRLVGGGTASACAMYDYIRLEMTGYIPPPPANVAAYAGNNANLICWPVTPGAMTYNILRSTVSGSGYVSITNGVSGPVCGSGFNNATYLDTNVVTSTTYYYVVRSVNPTGSSTNSPESSGATPDAGISSSAPAAPTGVNLSGVAHHSLTVNWSASPGANFYTVYRSTLFDTLGGSSNVLSTIPLANNVTSTSYADTSPTDGTIYSYFITATSAGGTSPNSVRTAGRALPAPPASAPIVTGSYSLTTSNVSLNWSVVSGAIGYIIRSGTASNNLTYVDNVVTANYTDTGILPGTYYYSVTAVNAAGVSTNAIIKIVSPPLAPASLSAIAGDSQIVLSWPATANATGYYLKVGTISGAENTFVLTNYSGTSYTNTGLANGTTYYYIVAATNAGGLSAYSPEAAATPASSINLGARTLTWKGDGSANLWDASGSANWLSNSVITTFNNGDTVIFNDTGSNNVPVTMNAAVLPVLTIVQASKNYTFSGAGSIAGTNILIKAGSGTLTVNTTNLYSGGTISSNGAIVIGNIAANTTAWGTGPIFFYGGTVQFNGYGGALATSWGGCTNALVVPIGQTGTILLPPRWGYSSPFTSPLTGSGTLNVTVDNIRGYMSGDWSGFDGLINVSPRSGTGDFRINNAAGYADAAFYLNSGVNFYNINANGQTTDIGELGGTSGAFIGTGSASSSNPTWRIGARNTTNTYAGTIADAGVTTLIKTGTGTLILTGTNNTYSGGTTINGGILLVANTNGSATGSGAITVQNGGTLSGNGIITGAVTVQNGGALMPGNPFGILTVSNSLTLASGATTLMQVQHTPLTNDSVKVTGTFSANGTLVVTDTGSGVLTNGDSFKLFSEPNFSGGFTNLVLPPLADNLAWNTNTLNANGTISVVVLTSPVISGIQITGTNLVISGTGGVSNWPYVVTATTNLTDTQWLPIATNQFDAGGSFSLTVTNAVNADQPQKFYKLQLQ